MDASFLGPRLLALAALCTPEMAQGGLIQGGLALGLLAGLFLAGAAGSVAHCAPMCGGFVLGQASDRMAQVPGPQLCEWRRLRAGLLLPYHLGRLTTYALLGALAGSGAALLARAPWFGWVSSALMVAAALVFLRLALVGMGLVSRPITAPAWSGLLARLTRRIGRRSAAGGYLLGLVLGLLPCGLLYGALFAAAAAGGPLPGALAMLCFGLGTVPMLMAIGVAGHASLRSSPGRAAALAPALMTWNAVMLLAAAGLRVLV